MPITLELNSCAVGRTGNKNISSWNEVARIRYSYSQYIDFCLFIVIMAKTSMCDTCMKKKKLCGRICPLGIESHVRGQIGSAELGKGMPLGMKGHHGSLSLRGEQ